MITSTLEFSKWVRTRGITQLTTCSGWDGLNFFLQLSIQVNFWPSLQRTRLTRVELVMSRVGSSTHP